MAETTLQRMARASSWSAEQRTAEVVLSTDADVGDGVVLEHNRTAIRWPERPIPVVLDHRREVSAVAGAITDLRLEPSGNGTTALVGRMQLDGPAADQAEPLLRTGAARWSIGARVHQTRPDSSSGLLRATSWSIGHLALVVEPADLAAITRSNTPESTMTESTPAAVEQQAEQLTREQRQAEKIELAVRRAATEANLPGEVVERILAEGHRNQTEAITAVVREYRLAIEAKAPVYAGHPARVPLTTAADHHSEPSEPLARALHRAVRGLPLDRPIVEELKAAGYAGKSGEQVVRAAFGTGRRSMVDRAFHSTSDAKDLLLSTGDRLLQQGFSEAPRGILELARIRPLADFREVSTIDAGLVGSAKVIQEGGEITYGSLQSEAGKYKPLRVGLGMAFTFEALQNDDLGGIAQVLSEVQATMLEAEAAKLGELLGGSGTGGTCPDGKALFHADHKNKATTPQTLSVDGLAAMVQLLRSQTSVGGRRVWLEPGYLLCGADLETTALKLLSESWGPTVPDDANPWKNLRLIVDPTVAEGYFYLVAAGPRKPFELGRVDGMPMMRQEEDFNTSGLRMKVEHAYGAACVDHRVIVRNK